MDADAWQRVRPVVVEALAVCDDVDVAKRSRYAVTRMALHLVDLGHDPTCQLLFGEALVAHWTATFGSLHAAATHRSTLAPHRPLPQPGAQREPTHQRPPDPDSPTVVGLYVVVERHRRHPRRVRVGRLRR